MGVTTKEVSELLKIFHVLWFSHTHHLNETFGSDLITLMTLLVVFLMIEGELR